MTCYEFGAFRIYPLQRRLSLSGADLKVGGRTFDVLTALVERHGQIVSHDELAKLAWPDQRVVESALRFQINSIRTLLSRGDGKEYVASVAGRGYCFTAQVSVGQLEQPSQTATKVTSLPDAVPLIGRDLDVANLIAAVEEGRLVSVVGPGGIGKTAVAMMVAHKQRAVTGTRLDFIDLAAVTDPGMVTSSIAAALGLGVHGSDPLPGIAAHLAGAPRLMIWDNCEHLIDACALLTERLLIQVPRVRILATSREPMRVTGEHVYRLGPLQFPRSDEAPDEVGDFAALDLFMTRAKLDYDHWTNHENRVAITKICRVLDGIPLAIELAAARVDDLGLQTVANLLDHSLSILTKSRASGPLRHQTMRQTLDWSYALLSVPEATALQGLSAFGSSFTREAAFAVAGGKLEADVFCTALSNLIYKSLVSVDVSRNPELYCLPQITRQYAIELLQRSTKLELVSRRHADYVRSALHQTDVK